ncbi:MAG TPA: hypothetical protein IGS40_22405 [Trichormus sp. M33_DOE_039]|nr:hypothetical protein [Trichormus sp. M33_DOE_039]
MNCGLIPQNQDTSECLHYFGAIAAFSENVSKERLKAEVLEIIRHC